VGSAAAIGIQLLLHKIVDNVVKERRVGCIWTQIGLLALQLLAGEKDRQNDEQCWVEMIQLQQDHAKMVYRIPKALPILKETAAAEDMLGTAEVIMGQDCWYLTNSL